jgi:DNA-binding PadR family transcriptional regulator
MRPQTYFVLAALLDGPLHGYGIVKRAADLSRGTVKLTAGTLYGALDRLAGEGLVAEDGQEIVAGRARRYYRLTDAGHDALEAEATWLTQAAAVVKSRRAVRVQPA